MGSINAQVFARKVSEKIRAGERVNKKQLAIESGYSPLTAIRSTQITNSKSYKVAFALENKEIVDKIDRDIARFQQALAGKNLKKEETKTIVSSLDTLIKNKQLLSGGSTGNIAMKVEISEHINNKYASEDDKKEDKT